VWSYLGNMLGAALLAGVCTYAGVFKSAATSIVSLAAYKAAMPFGVVSKEGGREGRREGLESMSSRGFKGVLEGYMSAHTLLTTCFLPLPSTPFPPFLPFQLVARGVLCNYLVCMAVWVSQAAADLVSKATAIVLIITIFASLSFEHSVANMFIGKEGGREGGKDS